MCFLRHDVLVGLHASMFYTLTSICHLLLFWCVGVCLDVMRIYKGTNLLLLLFLLLCSTCLLMFWGVKIMRFMVDLCFGVSQKLNFLIFTLNPAWGRSACLRPIKIVTSNTGGT